MIKDDRERKPCVFVCNFCHNAYDLSCICDLDFHVLCISLLYRVKVDSVVCLHHHHHHCRLSCHKSTNTCGEKKIQIESDASMRMLEKSSIEVQEFARKIGIDWITKSHLCVGCMKPCGRIRIRELKKLFYASCLFEYGTVLFRHIFRCWLFTKSVAMFRSICVFFHDGVVFLYSFFYLLLRYD